MQNGQDTGYALIYLLACALHAEQPDAQRVGEMDLDALYRLSKAQSLGSMTAGALLNSGALTQDEKPRWKELRDKSIRKNMLLDAERMQLTAFLEKEGIWYLPLKGVVIQKLYPAYGMRQMSDNDLLVDEKGMKSIERFMRVRGYKMHGGENHDCYLKEPVYNFEIHRALMRDCWSKEKKAEYYENIQQKLLPGDTPFARTMTQEDCYIYLTVHAYKHLTGGGTGLRAAVDQYVCTSAWQDMDAAYVQTELEKMDIAAFEKTLRGLAQKLFADTNGREELAPQEEELLCHMLGNGTYGTYSNRINNRIGKLERDNGKSKALRGKYLLKRLFPTVEQMKVRFPVLQRAAWLLPVMYVYRVLFGIFARSRMIVREVRVVLKRK